MSDYIGLLQLLQITGNKFAVAESLTGGHLQALVSSTSGISKVFEGGITAYNKDQKVGLLNVNEERAAQCNCVSAEIALEMAVGVCRLFKCSAGVATTGYAEPDPAHDAHDPFAHWAVVLFKNGTVERSKTQQVTGKDLNRVQMQHRVASQALEALISFLGELRMSS